MVRIKIFLFLILFPLLTFSQVSPGKYALFFTDKNNTGYSIDHPEQFLSQRAIERRTRQNISITENDLPVTSQYIDSLQSLGLEILNPSKWLNCVTVKTTDTALMDTITNLSFIKGKFKFYNENPVSLFPKFENISEKSNKSVTQTLIDYGSAANQIEMLNGQILHNQGYKGQGMLIAILDAGYINTNVLAIFDSVRAQNQIIATKDFVDGDTSVYAHHDHGTQVFSIIAANQPGQMVGTGPKAGFILIRTEDAGSEYLVEEYNWVSGAEYADSLGADIIQTSLGYNLYNYSWQSYTYNDLDGNTAIATRGADIAASKGILVVVSAGNEGSNSWHFVTVPADADSVLAVGAVDSNGNYGSISSTGPTPDGRVKPDIVAQGIQTTICTTSGLISSGNGTSFSSPIISGLAACLWQAHPELTNMQIIDAIKESSSQYNNPDSLLGYGIPDFAYANLLLNNIYYKNFESENLIRTYPNPFSDNITVDFYCADSQNVEIQLINYLGKLIYSKSYNLQLTSYNVIEISGLNNYSSGLYILRIKTSAETWQKKIIKN